MGKGKAVHAATTWERLKHQWQRELTFGASLTSALRADLIAHGVTLDTLNQPWISARQHEDGRWGIGCEVCSQAHKASKGLHLIRTDMATFSCVTARKDLWKKHQASVQHKKSVLQALGVNLGPTGGPLVGAPPLEVFNEVLAHVQRGESMRRMDQGGSGDRIKNVRFCLLEAVNEGHREFLRRAKTMVLLRDERHGRLLLRYAACTTDLDTRKGTLAVMRDYDSPTAANLVRATKQAFKQFCTARLGKPRSIGLELPKLDSDLFHHLRRITQMLVSDGAASELLAGEVSRGRRGSDGTGEDNALTPNVLLVGRDLAHCARHVLKKPWQADTHLSNLFETTVWHRNSVVQIIDKSDVFRQWFREYTAQFSARSSTPRVSNLSSAKHRFESCSKPLARLVLHLVPVFKVCHRIATERDSANEGGLVRNWLATVSSEDLLQLALLADAADESLLLVRHLDTEGVDLATLHSTVAHYMDRLDYLFKRGGCMTVENSFVQHCLSLLDAGQLQVLPHSERAGGHRVLARPSAEAVERCVRRMSVFSDMAKATVQAEFPDFLAINSFSVFALSDDNRAVAESPVDETHCQRLAQLFSVNSGELARQLSRLRPAAQAIKNSSKCSNQEAWQKAVQRSMQVQAGGKLDALQPVVMRRPEAQLRFLLQHTLCPPLCLPLCLPHMTP